MPTRVIIHLPDVPLHTEVDVEVNKEGQVVRVKSTKPSKVQSFNIQTYGNALQMWIRRPDGTAQVGLYRVTYDYNPKTASVTRRVSIISAGGTWANDPGAANVMIEMAKKQAAAAEAAERKAEAEQSSKLPSLNEIRGVQPTPKPTIGATLPP
jgi:fructose 1,6-bisphosphatase